MAKILYITANVKTVNDSFSLSVGQKFIQEYKRLNPNDEIEELDLFKTEIPFLDQAILGSVFGTVKYDELYEEHQRKFQLMTANLDQFIHADKYVFATPLWNLGVPPVLKAYFDNISIAGKTFKFTKEGPQGLLLEKKALCIQSSGGNYHTGISQGEEHGFSYIKTILAFFGVKDVQAIFIEGVTKSSNDTNKIKKNAIKEAKIIASNF